MNRARKMVLASVAAAVVMAAAPRAEAVDCARRLVAGGDHIPAGHEVEEDERFPNHLLDDHLSKWGPWCNYDIAVNGEMAVVKVDKAVGGSVPFDGRERDLLLTSGSYDPYGLEQALETERADPWGISYG